MRSAVSFDLKAVLKRVFSSFRKLQKLSVLFLSCNSAVRLKSFPLRHFSKPFHMRWQDQFLGYPCHLTLCFIVDNWTNQTKLWPCRPGNKHQQKERKKWKRVWRHARDRIINSHFAGKLNSFNMGGRGVTVGERADNPHFLCGASCVSCSGPRSLLDVSPQSKSKTRWVVDRGKGNVGVQTGKDCLLTCLGRYLGRRCEKSLIVGDQTCDLHCVKRARLCAGLRTIAMDTAIVVWWEVVDA